MQPITVGILGVGHLTYHMVPGLVAGETTLQVCLSPRNSERAQELSTRYGLEIAEDNTALVSQCDVILIGVRQFHAIEVVKGLPWRPEQTVVSCCAGLSLDELSPHVNGATVVRAMPVIAAEYRESPTCIFPDNDTATKVLGNCGTVIPLGSEHDFNAATVSVCYSSMLLGLLARMVEWNERAGIAPATARQLVTELTKSSAIMARERTDSTIDEMVTELATPGSFTLQGYEALWQADAFAPWVEASDALIKKLGQT